MTDKLERGQMYKADFIAVRAMAHVSKGYNYSTPGTHSTTIGWSIIMPRRDSRFGVLGSGRYYNAPEERQAIDAADLPMTDVQDGATRWIRYPHGWAWGIYIGDVRKYEAPGMDRSGWDGDEGGMGYGAKKIRLVTIALHGSNNGFVLLYAFSDDLEHNE